MSELTVHRARFIIDGLWTGDKLSTAVLVKILNRGGDALRVLAFEEVKRANIDVLLREDVIEQHVHYHDARYDTCRACASAARDKLGPIE